MPRSKIFFDKEMEFFEHHLSCHLVLVVDGLLKCKKSELDLPETQYLQLECRRIINEMEYIIGYVKKVCPSESIARRHQLCHCIFFTINGVLDIESDHFFIKLAGNWNKWRKQMLPPSLSFPEAMLRHEVIDLKNSELESIQKLLLNIDNSLARRNEIRFFEKTGEVEFNGVKRHFAKIGSAQFVVLNTVFSSKSHKVKVSTINSRLDDLFDELDVLSGNNEIRDPRKSKSLYNARDKINSKFKTIFSDVLLMDLDLLVLKNGFCGLSEMVKVKNI